MSLAFRVMDLYYDSKGINPFDDIAKKINENSDLREKGFNQQYCPYCGSTNPYHNEEKCRQEKGR